MNVIPKPEWNLSTIYISGRLQEYLRPFSRCVLTAVAVPMDYGKATTISWYLPERAKAEALHITRISVYSENLAIFWRGMQDAFARAGFDFPKDCACPTNITGGGLLVDEFYHELARETSCYTFVDDSHLLTDRRISIFFCMLTNRALSNVHLIAASRDRLLPAVKTVRLGTKVYQAGAEQLRLSHAGFTIYTHRCGMEFSETRIESFLYFSEGWFSVAYLNLRIFSEYDVLPNRNSDIYATFTTAMIDPLPEKQREFLVAMGLTDGFAVEVARFVTGDANAEERLSVLTAQNAFVACILDGVTYHFHHMMKECAERTFLTLPQGKRTHCCERLGLWYEQHRQCLCTITAYRKCENYDALLRVIRSDTDILLASLKSEAVLEALDKCLAGTLKAYSLAILVPMRRMFAWRQIPKMLGLRALLLTAIKEHPELSEEEHSNPLGECSLIMSFLCHNDISVMDHLHHSTSSRMFRLAISIQKSGGWTFDSPSVLMVYYRALDTL